MRAVFVIQAWTGVFQCYASLIASDCWSDDYPEALCCDLRKGPTGDINCWNPVAGFTFQQCCNQRKKRTVLLQEIQEIQQHVSGFPLEGASKSWLHGCEKDFLFAWHGSREDISQFIKASSPISREWGSIYERGTQNTMLTGNQLYEQFQQCEAISGILYLASINFTRFQGNHGIALASEARLCIPSWCSREELFEVGDRFVIRSLDMLGVVAELEGVGYTKVEAPSPPLVDYVAIGMVMLVMVHTILEFVLTRRFPWSIPSALQLLAIRPQDSVKIHLLRAWACSCIVLYHSLCEFNIQKWVRNSWWKFWIDLLSNSGTAGFFAVSFHLFFFRAESTGRCDTFMPRFVRKMFRQAAVSLVFFCFLAPMLRPSNSPYTVADVFTLSFFRKLWFSEYNWCVRTETWQFLLISALSLAESHGPVMSAGLQSLLWCLTLPCLWDSSDRQFPDVEFGNTLGKWWSQRVPICLLLFRFRGSQILHDVPWKYSVAGYVVFASVTAVGNVGHRFDFLLEVPLQVVYMMFVRARPNAVDDGQSNMEGKRDMKIEREERRIHDDSRAAIVRSSWDICLGATVAVSHLSPILLCLDRLKFQNMDSLIGLMFGAWGPESWYVTFPVQGIIILMNSFSVSLFVWIFMLHPMIASINVMLAACPVKLTNLAIGPAILAAVVYDQGYLLKTSYFQFAT